MSIYYQHDGKKEKVPDTLHIRMMTQEEAKPLVETFLDKCFMARIRVCYIVHGKTGTVLRKMVHKMLQEHPLVDSFRSGQNSEGEMGVTAVYLTYR